MKQMWLRFKIARTNLYYNINFTEYDTEIDQFQIKIFANIFNLNSSFWASYANGDNISYLSDYISTLYDRSYKEYVTGFSLKKSIKNLYFLDKIGINSVIKNRVYTQESTDDPLHVGREHFDYTTSVWVEKRTSKNINHQIKLKNRVRSVNSDFYVNYFGGNEQVEEVRVSNLKGFEKFEIIYKITFDTHLDFLY